MNPAPRRRAELEYVLSCFDEEVTVDECYEAGYQPPASDNDHHEGGEGCPANRGAAQLSLGHWMILLLSGPRESCVPNRCDATATALSASRIAPDGRSRIGTARPIRRSMCRAGRSAG